MLLFLINHLYKTADTNKAQVNHCINRDVIIHLGSLIEYSISILCEEIKNSHIPSLTKSIIKELFERTERKDI